MSVTTDAEVLESLDFPAPPVRYSYKWRVEAENYELWLDYVFADNADEAVTKAYEKLEIPPEVSISVQRIHDVAPVSMRLN